MGIPAEIGDEGPYGEFCGYSVGTVVRERIVDHPVHDHAQGSPLYHGFYLCKGINEEGVIKSVTASVQDLQRIETWASGHQNGVYCSEAGIGIFHCYIQIDEAAEAAGMVNNILAAIRWRQGEPSQARFRIRRRHRYHESGGSGVGHCDAV